MALPAGVTTATVIAGVPVTHTGAAVKAFVSIEPSAYLVHAATGTPLVDFLEELDISEGTAGQFILPHTDQAGFIDGSGAAYTNWYYTARVTYSTPSKAKTKAPKVKVFQLTTGQTTIDLDLLPEGAPALPYTAPAAKVDAFMGRTGAVTLLDADLPARLSETELSATYATPASIAKAAKNIPLRAAGDRFRNITVMVYHLVNQTNFNTDLDYYQEWNYTTVTLRDVWEHLEGISTLPDKPLLITFDDGIPSQYTAAQTLNTRGMKGVFYIATGWIDGTVTQAQGGFAEATPLTWTQLNQIYAWGHDIQSHSVNHQPLRDQVYATVVAEFADSKARIEAMVPGTLVEYIAYPYGSWKDETVDALEDAGCKLGRAVRIAADGKYPGANSGRSAIATTAHDRFGMPCAGTSNGDIQRPNFYRELSHDPEWVPDYGFEGGVKGWTLGSGFAADTNAANAHSGTKSLTCVQSTSTVSSRPARSMPIGPWNRLRISGWIKSTLPAGSYAKVQLQTLKYDGTVNGTNIDVGIVTGPAGWTQFTYEYVGLAADREALLFLAVQGNASPSGAAWFDDISVKVENMPSALTV